MIFFRPNRIVFHQPNGAPRIPLAPKAPALTTGPSKPLAPELVGVQQDTGKQAKEVLQKLPDQERVDTIAKSLLPLLNVVKTYIAFYKVAPFVVAEVLPSIMSYPLPQSLISARENFIKSPEVFFDALGDFILGSEHPVEQLKASLAQYALAVEQDSKGDIEHLQTLMREIVSRIPSLKGIEHIVSITNPETVKATAEHIDMAHKNALSQRVDQLAFSLPSDHIRALKADTLSLSLLFGVEFDKEAQAENKEVARALDRMTAYRIPENLPGGLRENIISARDALVLDSITTEKIQTLVSLLEEAINTPLQIKDDTPTKSNPEQKKADIANFGRLLAVSRTKLLNGDISVCAQVSQNVPPELKSLWITFTHTPSNETLNAITNEILELFKQDAPQVIQHQQRGTVGHTTIHYSGYGKSGRITHTPAKPR